MPIDSVLEGTRLEPASGASDVRLYDWRRIVAEGRAARRAADGGAWRIGSLALLVERRYRSGALRRFADEIGASLGTVRRFRWVAGTYDSEARARYADLTFSHFQAVASLPDRQLWLERAMRGGWSVDRLASTSRAVRPASDARITRPIEKASRSLGRLAERLEHEDVSPANRRAIARAVDELAETVGRLRARLGTPPRLRPVAGHGRVRRGPSKRKRRARARGTTR